MADSATKPASASPQKWERRAHVVCLTVPAMVALLFTSVTKVANRWKKFRFQAIPGHYGWPGRGTAVFPVTPSSLASPEVVPATMLSAWSLLPRRCDSLFSVGDWSSLNSKPLQSTGFIRLAGATRLLILCISFASTVFLGGYTDYSNADESDAAKFVEFLDAVERGDLKAIGSHLDRYPADINREVGDNYIRPNALVAANRNVEVVKLLLKYGADAGLPFGGGAGYSSPLLKAIDYSDSEFDDGFDSEADADSIRGPDGNFEFFQLLFHSIDSSADCVDTYPALEYSIAGGFDKKYIIYMLENNACVSNNYTGGWSTFNAALGRDVNLAKMMISKMSLNSSDGHGDYPLHHAVRYGDKSVVAMLLASDAYPFPVDDDGKTPLYYADPHKTVEMSLDRKKLSRRVGL